MKLVVGLGNPGRRYAATRHNVGFRIVERFAQLQRVPFTGRKFEGRFGRGKVGGIEVALLEPETFMNLAGGSVAEALRFLPVEDVRHDLIVVSDDVDLPFGRLRIRPGGGPGGHKGLRDIIERIGRDDFPRLRFGVGRPRGAMDTADYVLESFSDAEEETLGARIDDAATALESMLFDGVETAMNRFNRETPSEAPA